MAITEAIVNFSTIVPYDSNQTSSWLNWSHVTEDGSDEDDVGRMIHVTLRLPIILLGTVGNLLTFLTMRRGTLRNMSTCLYMAILALADTGNRRLKVYGSAKINILHDNIFLLTNKVNYIVIIESKKQISQEDFNCYKCAIKWI